MRRSGVDTFFGGFHTLLTSILSNGALFQYSTEEDVYLCWRNTEGKLNWVFKPSDPDQALRELHETKNALKAHMILGYLQTLQDQNLDRTEFELSLAEVVDHSIARSKEYPSIGLFLVALQHAETIMLMEESEREADFLKYQVLLRLLAPGFATPPKGMRFAFARLLCLAFLCL